MVHNQQWKGHSGHKKWLYSFAQDKEYCFKFRDLIFHRDNEQWNVAFANHRNWLKVQKAAIVNRALFVSAHSFEHAPLLSECTCPFYLKHSSGGWTMRVGCVTGSRKCRDRHTRVHGRTCFIFFIFTFFLGVRLITVTL